MHPKERSRVVHGSLSQYAPLNIQKKTGRRMGGGNLGGGEGRGESANVLNREKFPNSGKGLQR